MSDLLPCPFCGGAGGVWITGSKAKYNFAAVTCEECDGRTNYYETEAKAIAAWNRRATPETSRASLEQLKSEIDAAFDVIFGKHND